MNAKLDEIGMTYMLSLKMLGADPLLQSLVPQLPSSSPIFRKPSPCHSPPTPR